MALSALETRITESVETLSSSVVTIKITRPEKSFAAGGAPIQGSGSGFIIDSIGDVVTNYHVVFGASKVEVVLKDGRTYDGSIVGGDRATDVMLIRIDGTNLPVAKLGNSEKLKVGQMALAIGNALDLPGAPTVSLGVISALGRPLPWADFIFEGMIQTDAAINPGNSGGPLADLDGNVVGINTAMIPYAQGVGFAIPINTVKWVLEQVLEKGKVVRPMLGVLVMNLNPMVTKRYSIDAKEGALITNVFKDSPAQRVGLRELDIIEKIGPHEVKSTKDLTVALSKLRVNENVTIKFVRNGKAMELILKLAEAQSQ
jgi:S1-C subfamily serine protease